MELRSLGLPQHSSDLNLKELQQVTVELTTPEGHVYKVGRLSNEERAQKILKYVTYCKLAGWPAHLLHVWSSVECLPSEDWVLQSGAV